MASEAPFEWSPDEAIPMIRSPGPSRSPVTSRAFGAISPVTAQASVGANCLWPRTMIATAAVQNLLGGDEAMSRSRLPAIVADAAFEILGRDPRECTGHACIDDAVLAAAGKTDLSPYAASEDAELQLDLFVEDWGVTAAR